MDRPKNATSSPAQAAVGKTYACNALRTVAIFGSKAHAVYFDIKLLCTRNCSIQKDVFCPYQVVQEFLGFKFSAWAKLLYTLSCVCTGGVAWLLFKYIPKSLIMSRCPLSQAQYVQAKVSPPCIIDSCFSSCSYAYGQLQCSGPPLFTTLARFLAAS